MLTSNLNKNIKRLFEHEKSGLRSPLFCEIFLFVFNFQYRPQIGSARIVRPFIYLITRIVNKYSLSTNASYIPALVCCTLLECFYIVGNVKRIPLDSFWWS